MSLVKHNDRTIRKPCKVCGRTDLYWGHDTDKPGSYCSKCAVSGAFQLMDMAGNAHIHAGHVPDGPETPPEAPGEAYQPPAPRVPGSKAEAAAELLKLLTPDISPDEIRKIVSESQDAFTAELMARFDKRVAELSVPVRVEIIKPDGTVKVPKGTVHSSLPDVLTDIQARENVLMVGPAGTGKSHLAKQAAEALDLAFYEISLSPQTPSSALLGYMQVAGEYVPTLYRKAYEFGGVFHFDEFDNAHPSVLAVVNAGLAGDSMAFPDGMVDKHSDFRCVASANTYGRGADRMYVARQALDVATLDRFTVECIDVDRALEETLCAASGLDSAKVAKVLAYVRALRRNAEQGKMPLIFGLRASVGMCNLLAVGKPVDKAIAARVRKGISDADWVKVSAGVPALIV